MSQSCPGLVATRPPFVVPAALERDQIRLSYVGHSTFLIESPQLVRIATDYNDYVRGPMIPDIVTMNHAHSTHYTLSPDPGINMCCTGGWTIKTCARRFAQGCARAMSLPTSAHSKAHRAAWHSILF
jgi:hypothetical protein